MCIRPKLVCGMERDKKNLSLTNNNNYKDNNHYLLDGGVIMLTRYLIHSLKKVLFPVLFFSFFLVFIPMVSSGPLPISGYATWENNEDANGALVEVVSNISMETTFVGEGDWDSGYWQVDVGSPGPAWPKGTRFTVFINGTAEFEGWTGNKTGVIEDDWCDLGTIIVYGYKDSDQQNDSETNETNIDDSTNNNHQDDPFSTPSNPTTHDLPVADASAGEPYTGLVGETIWFNGSSSYARDGTIVNYSWKFNKGQMKYGKLVSYQFTQEGKYTVLLTVIDSHGHSDGDEIEVDIVKGNKPPSQPHIIGVNTGSMNKTYEFSFFSEDADNNKLQYIIDWDDGNTSVSSFIFNKTAFMCNHSWNRAGVYIIRVFASDNNTNSEKANFKVLINAEKIEEYGYFLDTNNDDKFEEFINETMDIRTPLGFKDNQYYFDMNNDTLFDYVYDLFDGIVSNYSEETDKSDIQSDTPGFEMILFSISLFLLIGWFTIIRK